MDLISNFHFGLRLVSASNKYVFEFYTINLTLDKRFSVSDQSTFRRSVDVFALNA